MKTFFILFTCLLLASPSFAQQTFNSVKIKDLEMPSELPSRASVIDANNKLKSSSVTAGELEQLEGVSSNVQDQIDSAVKNIGDESIDGEKTFIDKIIASSTTNGFHPCPTMTDTEMLAIVSPVNGDCVYNSTLDTWLVYSPTTSLWEEVGGGGGISNWVTTFDYVIGDVVIESSKIYQATSDHTSGTFATDLSGGKWTQIANNVSDASGILPMANGGTNKAMLVGGGKVVYLDSDSMESTAVGTTGQVLQSNGTAAPSWVAQSVLGKSENGTSSTVEELQVPNNLMTQTASGKYLNETGNDNILVNPSFEHLTSSTGWSGNVLNQTGSTSSLAPHGKQVYCKTFSGGALDLYQDSTLYESIFSADGGTQGVGFIKTKNGISSTPIYVCGRNAGAYPSDIPNSAQCKVITSDSKWGSGYEIPFTLAGTSNGIGITSNGVAIASGTICFDNAKVEARDPRKEIAVVGPWTAFTPTILNNGTTSSSAHKWRQVGENIEVEGYMVYTAAGAAGALTIPLPSGYVVDTTKTPLGQSVGFGKWLDNGVQHEGFVAYLSSSTQIILDRYLSATDTLLGSALGSGDTLGYSISVPVTQFAGTNQIYTTINNNTADVSQVIFTSQTTAPENYISAMNKSIGKTTGDYIGSEYYTLYSVLWAQAGLSTTAGDVYVISSTKGATALADWDAGKTIKIDYATNSPFIRAAGTGLNLGAYRDSENKSHNHTFNWGTGIGVTGKIQSGNQWNNAGTTFASTDQISNSGGTEAHPKEVALNAYIKYRSQSSVSASFKGMTEDADFTGTNQSIATNGYQKLPGGLIMQWGFKSSITVGTGAIAIDTALPIPFPNACLMITAGKNGQMDSAQDFSVQCSTTAYGMKVRSSNAGTQGATWFAIGY